MTQHLQLNDDYQSYSIIRTDNTMNTSTQHQLDKIFKIMHLNINGLSSSYKQSLIIEYIKDHKIDIGFVAETCMSIRSEQQFRQR